MRIGILGGVPAPLGGGGLEVQIEHTARALAARGHEVIRAERAEADARWDLLHAIGAERGVQFALEHWTRNRTPLVVSPVLVVAPGWQERLTVATSRLPVAAETARGRRRVLERADAVVAITAYERDVIARITRGSVQAVVVPNGVDVPTPAERSPLPEPGYLLLLGTVSARKRQAKVLRAAPPSARVVVVGAFQGSARERRRWDALAAGEHVSWLGEVRDPHVVARITADAGALVHLSRAEVQSLAVLEALALQTPVVLSDIPSHRELAERHPGWVALAAGVDDLERARSTLRPAPPPPDVPSWDDVAGQLEAVYRDVLA
jgi:glycosyltransferase involved in cell wall biosynthesis